VGSLVNDAKELVEKAWDWVGLRTTVTVSATLSDSTYTLTGAGTNFKVLDAYNGTQKTRLTLLPLTRMNELTQLSTAASGPPDSYSYSGVDTNGDMTIIVYPTPDASYTLSFDMVQREAELTADADPTLLPHYPIIMLAVALAARERGETGGTAAAELFGLADRALGDAIALDAQHFPSELTWRAI
jgi:hypothetical protein